MKSLIFVSLFIGSMTMANELEIQKRPTKAWSCLSSGQQNVGYPGVIIRQTFWGFGDTQLEASHNAVSNCNMSGMTMCMVENCHQNK